jgi:hypothetical protein
MTAQEIRKTQRSINRLGLVAAIGITLAGVLAIRHRHGLKAGQIPIRSKKGKEHEN